MTRDYCEALKVRHSTGAHVDVAGVPQITDRAARLIMAGVDCFGLPADVEAESDAAIAAATAELRRRKEAASVEVPKPVEIQTWDGASRDKQRRGREGK